MKIVARNIKYVWQVTGYFFLQALFPLLVLPVLITFSISVKSLGFILLSRNKGTFVQGPGNWLCFTNVTNICALMRTRTSP